MSERERERRRAKKKEKSKIMIVMILKSERVLTAPKDNNLRTRFNLYFFFATFGIKLIHKKTNRLDIFSMRAYYVAVTSTVMK